MSEPTTGSMIIASDRDVALGRQTVRKLAQSLRFSLVDQTRIVTAASELSRNAVVHGGGGEMRWELLSTGVKSGLRLAFEDHGPGIPDLDLALTDGWTSGAGMGVGLSGSRRLVDDFELRSVAGQGTCVTVTRWK